MNNRIANCARDATSYVNALYESLEVEPEGDFLDWFNEQFQIKFAALIVAECATIVDIIDSKRSEVFYHQNGEVAHTGDALKRFFGFDQLTH